MDLTNLNAFNALIMDSCSEEKENPESEELVQKMTRDLCLLDNEDTNNESKKSITSQVSILDIVSPDD